MISSLFFFPEFSLCSLRTIRDLVDESVLFLSRGFSFFFHLFGLCSYFDRRELSLVTLRCFDDTGQEHLQMTSCDSFYANRDFLHFCSSAHKDSLQNTSCLDDKEPFFLFEEGCIHEDVPAHALSETSPSDFRFDYRACLDLCGERSHFEGVGDLGAVPSPIDARSIVFRFSQSFCNQGSSSFIGPHIQALYTAINKEEQYAK